MFHPLCLNAFLGIHRYFKRMCAECRWQPTRTHQIGQIVIMGALVLLLAAISLVILFSLTMRFILFSMRLGEWFGV